jgi:hypothetical protein
MPIARRGEDARVLQALRRHQHGVKPRAQGEDEIHTPAFLV